MEERDLYARKNLFDNVLGVVMFLVTIPQILIYSFIIEMDSIDIVRAMVFSALISALTVFYIKSSRFNSEFRHYRWVIAIGFMLSVSVSLVSGTVPLYFFWIIGAVLISAMTDMNLGLMLSFLSVLLMSVSDGHGADALVYRFMVCAVAVLTARYLKNIKNLFYVIIITVTCDVTIKLIMSGFLYEDAIEDGLLYDAASIVISVIVCFLISRLLMIVFKEGGQEPVAAVATDEVISGIIKTEDPENHQSGTL